MENSRSGIICHTCPLCNSRPSFNWVELTPWFCPNEECIVLCWDPYTSREENLADIGPIDL